MVSIQLNGGEFSCQLKGAQSRWTPCEMECLAIKLPIHHYQPFIRESKNITSVFTDNIVTVHAWNAIKQGKMSTSSRVASFISTLCENRIDIFHIPGDSTKVADYNSRNPTTCSDKKCQVCLFLANEIAVHDIFVRHISSDGVPLAERPTWIDLQKQDSTIQQLFKLIKQGQAPKKKVKNRSLKLLHNLYKRGVLFIAGDGLIQVKTC